MDCRVAEYMFIKAIELYSISKIQNSASHLYKESIDATVLRLLKHDVVIHVHVQKNARCHDNSVQCHHA